MFANLRTYPSRFRELRALMRKEWPEPLKTKERVYVGLAALGEAAILGLSCLTLVVNGLQGLFPALATYLLWCGIVLLLLNIIMRGDVSHNYFQHDGKLWRPLKTTLKRMCIHLLLAGLIFPLSLYGYFKDMAT